MSCRNIIIRVNEPTNGGIVIAALEVVESGFGIVIVAPVADGVGGCEGAFGGEDAAPCVVGVGGKDCAVRGNHALHIALLVLYEDALGLGIGGFVGVAYQLAAGAVVEVESVACAHIRHKPAAVPDVPARGSVHRFLGAETGVAVGKGQACPVLLHGRELSPTLPAHAPAAVACRVADPVVGYRLAVVGCQEIPPCGVAVSVRDRDGVRGLPVGVVIFGLGEDVPAEIVSVVPRFPRRRVVLPDKLVQAVISVGRCAVA